MSIIVSGLDKDDDWRFGKSRAQYKRNGNAVYQNVQTRIKSFVNDWFLDTARGIDWYTLLGNKGTETQILRAIERVVLETDFVKSITKLAITKREANRGITIELAITTLFEDTISDEIRIET